MEAEAPEGSQRQEVLQPGGRCGRLRSDSDGVRLSWRGSVDQREKGGGWWELGARGLSFYFRADI